jgi:hypothetical protein
MAQGAHDSVPRQIVSAVDALAASRMNATRGAFIRLFT